MVVCNRRRASNAVGETRLTPWGFIKYRDAFYDPQNSATKNPNVCGRRAASDVTQMTARGVVHT